MPSRRRIARVTQSKALLSFSWCPPSDAVPKAEKQHTPVSLCGTSHVVRLTSSCSADCCLFERPMLDAPRKGSRHATLIFLLDRPVPVRATYGTDKWKPPYGY